jgi:hypothetical protein
MFFENYQNLKIYSCLVKKYVVAHETKLIQIPKKHREQGNVDKFISTGRLTDGHRRHHGRRGEEDGLPRCHRKTQPGSNAFHTQISPD